jgi:hypothetical protein
VREDEPILCGVGGSLQVAANGRFGRTVYKRFEMDVGSQGKASKLDFLQALVDFENPDFVREFGPAALGLGILEGGAASLVGLPVPDKHVLVFGTSAVEDIATVPAFSQYGGEFPNGSQCLLLMTLQGDEDRDRKNFF